MHSLHIILIQNCYFRLFQTPQNLREYENLPITGMNLIWVNLPSVKSELSWVNLSAAGTFWEQSRFGYIYLVPR